MASGLVYSCPPRGVASPSKRSGLLVTTSEELQQPSTSLPARRGNQPSAAALSAAPCSITEQEVWPAGHYIRGASTAVHLAARLGEATSPARPLCPPRRVASPSKRSGLLVTTSEELQQPSTSLPARRGNQPSAAALSAAPCSITEQEVWPAGHCIRGASTAVHLAARLGEATSPARPLCPPRRVASPSKRSGLPVTASEELQQPSTSLPARRDNQPSAAALSAAPCSITEQEVWPAGHYIRGASTAVHLAARLGEATSPARPLCPPRRVASPSKRSGLPVTASEELQQPSTSLPASITEQEVWPAGHCIRGASTAVHLAARLGEATSPARPLCPPRRVASPSKRSGLPVTASEELQQPSTSLPG
ncbi:zonadhesin-like [Bacillus rossius redtenbacheri]|uniref:zonadhesin-like n=1 Tax=Bacillus rossius redtenbacheri TaxID=93214 RepID=UPI002FDE41B6